MPQLPISSGPSAARKRKAPADMSQNPHTVKARKRNADLAKDSITLQISKAKAADQSAITVAKRKLTKSAAYASASPADQLQMVQDSAAAVKLKRYFLFFLY
jgi:hypothetical protein